VALVRLVDLVGVEVPRPHRYDPDPGSMEAVPWGAATCRRAPASRLTDSDASPCKETEMPISLGPRVLWFVVLIGAKALVDAMDVDMRLRFVEAVRSAAAPSSKLRETFRKQGDTTAFEGASAFWQWLFQRAQEDETPR
jgi:hypothetical protein